MATGYACGAEPAGCPQRRAACAGYEPCGCGVAGVARACAGAGGPGDYGAANDSDGRLRAATRVWEGRLSSGTALAGSGTGGEGGHGGVISSALRLRTD